MQHLQGHKADIVDSFELVSCWIVSVKHIPWQVAKDPTVHFQILFLCSNLSRGYSLRRVKIAICCTGFYASYLIEMQQFAALAGKLNTLMEMSFCCGCTYKSNFAHPESKYIGLF